MIFVAGSLKSSPVFRRLVTDAYFLVQEGPLSDARIWSHKSLERDNKQLLDEVEHDIMNYQNRGLCYLPKPKAEADNTDTRL